MLRPLLLALTAVASPLLAPSGVAHAAGTPAQLCAGAKQKAAGTAAGASLKCHAKAAQKGTAADPACLAKADTKLAKAFEKAEARGGCATTGDAGAVGTLLDSSMGAFVAALRPVASANRCAGAKLKETGKAAKAKLVCHAKATGRGLAVDPRCLAKAEARFTTAFARAEARPPCLTTGDAAAVASLVDALVAAVVGSPPPVTTTTTITGTTSTTTTLVPPQGQTTFEFLVPTGKQIPATRSSTLVVPGLDVFATLEEYEAAVVPVITDSLTNMPEIRSLTSFTYSLPVPRVTISGEQTMIVGELAGVDVVDLAVRYRLDEPWRTLCGSNIPVHAHFTDMSAQILIDFFTGDPIDVEIAYSSISVDYDCTVPLIGDIVQIVNDVIGFIDPVEKVRDALHDVEGFAEDSLNGRYANLFSLETVLAGLQEVGPQDVREFFDDVMRLLGGLSSAVATVMADEITVELSDRLSLQTGPETDQLREELSGLEEEIAARIPDLTGMTPSEVNAIDLSSYLTPRLPDLQQLLVERLEDTYPNAPAAVAGLEVQASDAVEDFVAADWARLIGGVNLRVTLLRAVEKVLIEAYHDAPPSFIGEAEAVAPCFPTYTVAEAENVTTYSIYYRGTLVYRGPVAGVSFGSPGLFGGAVTAQNYFGLHSYPTSPDIELINWGDYPGGQEGFIWPPCNNATSLRVHGGGGTTTTTNPPSVTTTTTTAPTTTTLGGGGPGGDCDPPIDPPCCGPETGIICP